MPDVGEIIKKFENYMIWLGEDNNHLAPSNGLD